MYLLNIYILERKDISLKKRTENDGLRKQWRIILDVELNLPPWREKLVFPWDRKELSSSGVKLIFDVSKSSQTKYIWI